MNKTNPSTKRKINTYETNKNIERHEDTKKQIKRNKDEWNKQKH